MNYIDILKKETNLLFEDSTYGNDATYSITLKDSELPKIMLPNSKIHDESNELYNDFQLIYGYDCNDYKVFKSFELLIEYLKTVNFRTWMK